VKPVERRGVQRGAACVERGEALPPRRDRVRLVESRDGRHLLPEELRIRPPEHVSGPALGGADDDVPGDRVTGRLIVDDLANASRFGTSRPCLIDIAEEVGVRVAEYEDQRCALHRQDGCLQPGGRAVEQLVGRVQRVQAALVLVAVDELHVAGARLPARLGDRAHQRCVLGLPHDEQRLARLQVHADANGELRVRAGELVDHGTRLSDPHRTRQTGDVAYGCARADLREGRLCDPGHGRARGRAAGHRQGRAHRDRTAYPAELPREHPP
jgi:hypothetical protein